MHGWMLAGCWLDAGWMLAGCWLNAGRMRAKFAMLFEFNACWWSLLILIEFHAF
jgi:hypothetical protein